MQQGSGTFVHESTLPTESLEQRLNVASFDEINAVRKLQEEEIVKLAVNHSATQFEEME